MKTHLTILLTIHFLSLLPISNSSKPQTPNSIRDLLQSKGLPGGLFPSNIKSYRVDQDGQLEVWFDRPCFATFEGDFRFETVVRGNLSYGGLAGVEGISQKELFLWFSVRDIVVNDPSSGIIVFNIGVAEKQLSVSVFEDPPICKPQTQGLAMWKMRDEGDPEDER